MSTFQVPFLRELPPTAGLPMTASDLLGAAFGRRLEAELAGFLGVPAVQIESSGTACLVIALECLKKRSPRREVIIPAYTCPLVALAVAQAGLEVKLCDTLPRSTDMNPAVLAEAIGKNTLAVVPTHMAGLPADLKPVLDLAREAGAFVIEDAAQSLGASWQGQPAGTAGDIGFFSLSFGKGLTIGEGGFLVARDPDLQNALAQTSKDICRFEPFDELQKIACLLSYACLYNPVGLRFVYGEPLRHKLSAGDLIGAVGDRFASKTGLNKVSEWRKSQAAAAFTRLQDFVQHNAERGRKRAGVVNSIPGLLALNEVPGTSGSWPFIFVVTDSEKSRDQVLNRLWSSGLGVTRLFIHDLTGYEYLNKIVPSTSVPNARELAACSFTITNSPWLTNDDFDDICKELTAVSSSDGRSRNLERKEIAL